MSPVTRRRYTHRRFRSPHTCRIPEPSVSIGALIISWKPPEDQARAIRVTAHFFGMYHSSSELPSDECSQFAKALKFNLSRGSFAHKGAINEPKPLLLGDNRAQPGRSLSLFSASTSVPYDVSTH